MPSGRRRRSRRRAAASGSVEPPLGQHVPGRSLWAGASGGGGEGPLGQEVPGRSGLAAAGGSGSGDGPLGPELPGRKGSAVASGGGEGQLGHKGSTVIRLGSGSHQQPDLPSRQREEMFLGSDSSSESEPVIPITYTSSRGDELAGSAPSPSVCSGRERKRKRGMITTSSPHPNRSPSKPPLWDTSENKAAAEKSSDSSEYSSPIRRPKSLLVKKTTASGRVIYSQNSDQEVVAAYHRDYHKYQKKLARLQELPTLKPCKYGQNIIDCHDLDQKKAVIDVAGSVVTLSSYNGYTEINRCTGIIVEWIEVNRSAIVVTSSQIICTKISLDDWEDNNVYAPSAKPCNNVTCPKRWC